MTAFAEDQTIPPSLFFGRWTVSRVIFDRLGKGRVIFEGTAVLDGEGFSEQGETLIGEFRAPSSRAYQLQFDRDAVMAKFPDGRDFIRIDAKASQRVHHDCGDDVYRGRLFFTSRDTWVEAWQVTGPRKNYRSIARYNRV